jgi:hypothetical protein
MQVMGEYARYNGSDIKIGTCEDMYYLRADQAHLVTAPVDGMLDPIKYAAQIRFRFPFPEEDAGVYTCQTHNFIGGRP